MELFVLFIWYKNDVQYVWKKKPALQLKLRTVLNLYIYNSLRGIRSTTSSDNLENVFFR